MHDEAHQGSALPCGGGRVIYGAGQPAAALRSEAFGGGAVQGGLGEGGDQVHMLKTGEGLGGGGPCGTDGEDGGADIVEEVCG
ncbi:hypothetical protein ADK93_27175 [Streptomyces sp. XY58]|nr:hypothetical protein VR43_26430 [Streptomyces sp. NRRL S-104]KOU83431.1 hypothetical protein ADK93_27175 [Streptomyces sp. XY58]KOV05044.1 hypothetical protein ADK89_20960 [Streptomyces sp. XY37]KOV46348.1 hypothetical protein ADK99_22295 [Streptomyces sp. MMG1064]